MQQAVEHGADRAGINVPDAAVAGRFSSDTHWRIPALTEMLHKVL